MPEPLSAAREAEIRARQTQVDDFVPGDWDYQQRWSGMIYPDETTCMALGHVRCAVGQVFWINDLGHADGRVQAIGDYVAHAHQDIPALLVELDRLRAAMRSAIGTLDALAGPPRPHSSGEVPVTLGVVTTAIADELRKALADAAPPSVGERGER